MNVLEEIKAFVQQGRAKNVKALAQDALDQGLTAADILENGLLAGMNIIGEKFKEGQAYIPEVLIAARDERWYGGLKARLSGRGRHQQGQGRFGNGQGRPARHRQEHRQNHV